MDPCLSPCGDEESLESVSTQLSHIRWDPGPRTQDPGPWPFKPGLLSSCIRSESATFSFILTTVCDSTAGGVY